ncbi:hypothetical protein MRX96_032982 [Rhipicephalus microplus]|uniref:Transmembrane protein n=1 Tax=Rhipicephalus microplus TaxID=6941 RepID=A0A9J6D3H5_RHIMP|nr:hypothetical protein HPB51_000246 [Rhipicephalus microplus]
MEGQLGTQQCGAAAAWSHSVAADQDGKSEKELPEGAPGRKVIEVVSPAASGASRPSQKGATIEGYRTTTPQHCVKPEQANQVVGAAAGKSQGYATGHSGRGKAATSFDVRPQRDSTSLCLCVFYLVALLLIFGVAIHAVHSNRAVSKEHPKLLVASPSSNSESSSSSEATSLSLRVTEASEASWEDELLSFATSSLPLSPATFSQKLKAKPGSTNNAQSQGASQESGIGEGGLVNNTEVRDIQSSN